MSDEDTIQYQDGWYAKFHNHVEREENPYDQRLQRHSYDLWDSGWRQAAYNLEWRKSNE